MLGYRIPDANEAMLISGGKAGKGQTTRFRIVTGHGAFVAPFFRRAKMLNLSLREAEVQEDCYTKQGLQVQVKAVCAFKVANDVDSIATAAEQFLSDQSQMESLTGRIFAGHLRSVVGSMDLEEIMTERQKLAENVLEASETEMGKLGFEVKSFQIETITGASDYIAALAAPKNAQVQQAAAIAQAKAQQAAAEAQQASAQAQSEYAKKTALVQAANQAEVDAKQAEADAQGPLSAAKAQQSVAAEQTELAQRNAELRAQQLQSEVVKPAEAQAAQQLALAEADAKATKLKAEAAAANDRVSLDQIMIQQLPEVAKALADGLRGSNLTVLNGAEGVTEILTGVMSQGKAIFDTVRNLNANVQQLPPGDPDRDSR